MLKYILRIYKARYFWWSLVKADLRNKYRRSILGILWSLLYPLLFTLLLVFIFGSIFKSDVSYLMPYIYSGIVVWDAVSNSFIVGSAAIIASEAYIKQFAHPLAIYSLKQTLVIIINTLISGVGMLAWCAIAKPENITVIFLSLPATLILLSLLSWCITTISAIINTKFRDYQQMIGLVMQALWFLTPVYFEKRIYLDAKLSYLLDYNPLAHLLNLVREPFLNGTMAHFVDYLYVIGLIVILGAFSIMLLYKNEKEMIFYI
jgi:lipopolysaccharide transport system permease protein